VLAYPSLTSVVAPIDESFQGHRKFGQRFITGLAVKTLVWFCNVGNLDEERFLRFESWLSNSEKERYRHFVRAERRRQFLVGRVLVRLALAELLGIVPSEVMLLERVGNAPALALPERPCLGLSISHSGPWVACAVSLVGPVGLDIECIDPARDVLAMTEQAFGAEVAVQLEALNEDERLHVFYRMWCRHEARIKLGCEARHNIVHTLPGLVLVLSSMQSLNVAPTMIDMASLLAA